jgi:hypothetical protein
MHSYFNDDEKKPKHQSFFRRKMFISIIFLFFTGSLTPFVIAAENTEEPPIIGVLYINSPTGNRFLNGVQAAIKNSDVSVLPLPYTDATHGTHLLKETVENEKVDILIGPTESDVYVRALEQRSELEKHSVPVISSLVTADVQHVPSGWFFLTNVGVRRRTQTTYDFLNKHWVKSIVILHANTEFGRRAEQAFSAELSATQRENYLSLSYPLPAINARPHIRKILDQRPEAVGIFGEREDIELTTQMLNEMNEGTMAYNPIIFTIIDARHLVNTVGNIYFVSVTEMNKTIKNVDIAFDDVTSLAYDTTNLILGELNKLQTSIHTVTGRKNFRDKFETRLQMYPAQEKNASSMSFSHYVNVAAPKLFEIETKGKDEPPEIIELHIEDYINFSDKVRFKLTLLVNRFGYIPWINAALIVFVILSMSIIDLKKWYVGNAFLLIIPSSFYLLLLVNSTLVLALYIFMGETGAIRYDSTLAALILSFAPMALLRTNFFETSTGKAIGLANLYDGFLQWVNDRLMITSHNLTKLYVDLIAYHNTVDGMREYLIDIYRGQPNAERRIKLTTELTQLVNDSIPYIARRKVCARLLLRVKKWHELRSDSMAPQGRLPENTLGKIIHKLDLFWFGLFNSPEKKKQYEENKYYTHLDELENPETLIRDAARHCSKNQAARTKLKKLIESRLSKLKDADRRKDLENELHKDIKDVVGEQARLRREIGFLFIIRGYDAEQLKKDLKLP